MLTFSDNTYARTPRLWLAALLGLFLLVGLLSYVQVHFRPVTLPVLPDNYKFQCASYAPYRLAGQTPFNESFVAPASQIEEDLQQLAKRFDCVRTYATNQGLDQVPAIAQKYGLKVYQGAWIGRESQRNQKEIERAVALTKAYPDTIRGLIVGNEVLLRREQTEEKLAALIAQARAQVSVPVTYADVWEFWLKHPKLADSVDFVTVHILPFWEDDPQPIERAMAHVGATINKVKQTFNKPILIGETGWPSAGRQRETAVPSLVNEARYLREFALLAEAQQLQYNIIEAIDQPWKRRSEGTVGGYWGVFDTQLQLKFSLSSAQVSAGASLPHYLSGLAGAIIMLLLGRAWRRSYPSLKPPRELLLMVNGALIGTVLSLQWLHAQEAYRNLLEWSILGGLTLISAATGIGMTLAAGSLHDSRRLPLALIWVRRITLFGAAVAGVLLLFDPRYRDFPTLLYLPAAFGLLAAFLTQNRRFKVNAHEHLLGIVLASSLVGSLYREGLANQQALAWIATAILLLIPVMLQRRQHDQ